MINLLILLTGVIVLGLSLFLGIVLPIGRATPQRGGVPAVPRAHVARGLVGSAIGLLLVVVGLSQPFVEVPAGNVGVVTNFGSVQTGTLEPGLHIVMPIVQHVATIDTRVQPHQFQEIDAASAEYQTVKLTGVMNYHVDGQFASDLYQRVGTDFASKVIDPAFNDFIKTVVPAYKVDASSAHATRSGPRPRTRSPPTSPSTTSSSTTSTSRTSPSGMRSSRRSRPSRSPSSRSRPSSRSSPRRRSRPSRRSPQAQGQADARSRWPNGQAQANNVLAASLSDQILQYQYIQKLTDKIQVMLAAVGTHSIFDLKELLKQSTPAASPAP